MSPRKITSLMLSATCLLSACSSLENQSGTSNADKALSQKFSQTVTKTYARYVPERNDDFAWENDLVAFRAYGPAARSGAENSGLDCWLKRVKYPIINKWYKQELEQGKTYHKDWGEGLDNYHVGSSAGCGSSALWLNGERKPLEVYTQWKMLKQTDAKTEFMLTYENNVNGDLYKEEKIITIELGSRLFKTTSTYWKNGVVAQNLPIAIGVTTHDESATVQWDKDSGYLSSWENIAKWGLGTGVLVAPEKIQDVVLVSSNGVQDKGHALFITETDNEGKISYYAGYGWEKAKEITNHKQWQNYLLNYSKVAK